MSKYGEYCRNRKDYGDKVRIWRNKERYGEIGRILGEWGVGVGGCVEL